MDTRYLILLAAHIVNVLSITNVLKMSIALYLEIIILIKIAK